MLLDGEPQVLRPYHAAETLTIEQAALIAGRSPRTIRDWAARFDIGRRIQGRWAISKVALGLFLDGDVIALAASSLGTAVPRPSSNIFPDVTCRFRGALMTSENNGYRN
jgi:hypothetical protein